MDKADADGQLPAVTLPVEPPGPEDLHLMAVVLFEAPDAVVEDSPRLHERLADQRREAVYQHPGDEGREDADGVPLEGPYPRPESLVIKPVRVRRWCVKEEFTKQWRRVPQTLVILLHPRLNELVDLIPGQGLQLLHHPVHDRIADEGVGDVGIRGLLIEAPGLLVARPVVGWHGCQLHFLHGLYTSRPLCPRRTPRTATVSGSAAITIGLASACFARPGRMLAPSNLCPTLTVSAPSTHARPLGGQHNLVVADLLLVKGGVGIVVGQRQPDVGERRLGAGRGSGPRRWASSRCLRGSSNVCKRPSNGITGVVFILCFLLCDRVECVLPFNHRARGARYLAGRPTVGSESNAVDGNRLNSNPEVVLPTVRVGPPPRVTRRCRGQWRGEIPHTLDTPQPGPRKESCGPLCRCRRRSAGQPVR